MISDVQKVVKKLQEMAQEATELAATIVSPDSDLVSEKSIFHFGDKRMCAPDPAGGVSRRQSTPSLPAPHYLRALLKAREARSSFFETKLFADPAWDMIIDLTLARVEGRRISVTSLCSASGVPHTTALRWISQMVEDGIFVRTEDDQDRRRSLISLSDDAAAKAARYFEHIQAAMV